MIGPSVVFVAMVLDHVEVAVARTPSESSRSSVPGKYCRSQRTNRRTGGVATRTLQVQGCTPLKTNCPKSVPDLITNDEPAGCVCDDGSTSAVVAAPKSENGASYGCYTRKSKAIGDDKVASDGRTRSERLRLQDIQQLILDRHRHPPERAVHGLRLKAR